MDIARVGVDVKKRASSPHHPKHNGDTYVDDDDDDNDDDDDDDDDDDKGHSAQSGHTSNAAPHDAEAAQSHVRHIIPYQSSSKPPHQTSLTVPTPVQYIDIPESDSDKAGTTTGLESRSQAPSPAPSAGFYAPSTPAPKQSSAAPTPAVLVKPSLTSTPTYRRRGVDDVGSTSGSIYIFYSLVVVFLMWVIGAYCSR